MMKRITTTLAVLFLMTAIMPSPAQACRCLPPPPPKDAMEKSAAVFVGRVVSVELNRSHGKMVTFAVDRAWKGVDAKKFAVTTSNDSCGYIFEKDKEYLVYANGGEGKRPSVNLCTRTRTKADGADDIKELGEGKEPVEKEKPAEK